jgi:Ca2+-dependent lipid-binding protein
MITLQIDCFDWDKDTEHDLIGSFETTLRELAPAKDREVGSIISLE